MKDGLIRVAVACPPITLGSAGKNAAALLETAGDAAALGAQVLLFPELCLVGYTAGDLFFSAHLLAAAEDALASYIRDTASLDLISFVGLPVSLGGKLYNCVAAVAGGRLLGLVPKSYIPAAGDAPESRFFAKAPDGNIPLRFAGQDTLLGTRQIFTCREMPLLRIAAEIGCDLDAPVPPSCAHTAAGATLIVCPTATSATVGRAERTLQFAAVQSARTHSAYLQVNAGEGESGTDTVFAGGGAIFLCGKTVREMPAFADKNLLYTEIDLARAENDRRRSGLFEADAEGYEGCEFTLSETHTAFSTPPSRTPFIPTDREELAARCESILTVQANGLAGRTVRAYAKTLVLGISGGLDSTLSLLVACRALDLLSRDRREILAVTMPGFGTTARTKGNAEALCEALGVSLRTVDIQEAVRVHFRDIGHPEEQHDTTYENAQARERTQILMDISNATGGFVVGTGDLSELALGWATYNGDHMSMYGTNTGVPKTLIRYLVAHEADRLAETNARAAEILRDILATPVSPELLPPTESGEIAQKTEGIVGPYELHDFFLYHFLRGGCSPRKLLRLANAAFCGVYEEKEILRHLHTFLRRFFSQQFKRSCLPDGPRIGSVSLSPRGGLVMPSDASSEEFTAELPVPKD